MNKRSKNLLLALAGRLDRTQHLQPVYRALKRWWPTLDHRTRGEIRGRLEAGLMPLPRHMVGAPALVGGFDYPVPKCRVGYRRAELKRAAKARWKKKRENSIR